MYTTNFIRSGLCRIKEISLKLKVGVVGASGYVGGELLRLLVSHPKVEISIVISRQKQANMYTVFIRV